MAYYNGYPVGYQYFQQQNQIQNNGFVPVPSEEVARNYPVAAGNSVTFKNENAPYVYTKTMGFSQLDRPMFEKYKLVKEEDAPAEVPAQPTSEPLSKIEKEIENLWSEVNALKKPSNRRKDSED